MKRDQKTIQSKLVIKDNKVYTKEKTIIEFPKWYQEKGLANIEEKTYIYGLFAIIIGDVYSVSIIPTLIPTTPILVNEIEKDGTDYIQFIYNKEDCLLDSISVVKQEELSFNFFENFYLYARIPWYLEYEDMVKIMDNLPIYAKSNVGDNYLANELTTSFITRNKNNKEKFYRQLQKENYEFVDLMNVYYSVNNTVNKLAGGYFTESLTSAIVQKNNNPTSLERHVRE